MRIALDTNILVYAEGFGDRPRCERARDLLAAVPAHAVVVPAQCLGELFRVLHGKAGLPRVEALDRVLAWVDVYEITDSRVQAFLLALDLVRTHSIQIWDALIVSVASMAKCRLLVTEDAPSANSLAGVKAINPFENAAFQEILVTAVREPFV